ncbi:hypothetical protein C0Q70_12882 [Pomacea canaliculata]|uniref:Uncharacterized protein n=2 Tax=Pomacea canaliculata TaxID=400727 RepID=A0A2T7P2S2_POMCA|nr:hypothetical protein C0Q70_12882 [Pomacea canaliculata]
MIIILVTAIIVIFVIRRKRIISHSIPSYSEDNIDELIVNSYYGGSQVNGRDEFEMVEEDYAEVSDSERHEGGTTEFSLCANAETNEKRQTENIILYSNMETKEGIETPQVDLCIAVDENKEKQQVKPELDALLGEHHYKGDNSRSLNGNDFACEEETYAVIDEDSDPDSHT